MTNKINPAIACLGFSKTVFMTNAAEIITKIPGTTGYQGTLTGLGTSDFFILKTNNEIPAKVIKIISMKVVYVTKSLKVRQKMSKIAAHIA